MTENLIMSRILIASLDEATQPESLLQVFNSNLDYLEAAGMRQQLDADDVARVLYEETNRENSHCLLIRLAESREIIGLVALVAPLPSAGVPLIGLVLVDGIWQRTGIGAEAVCLVEEMLQAEGWEAARLNVLKNNPGAMRFWKKLGYRIIEVRDDQDRRPVWVMGKALMK